MKQIKTLRTGAQKEIQILQIGEIEDRISFLLLANLEGFIRKKGLIFEISICEVLKYMEFFLCCRFVQHIRVIYSSNDGCIFSKSNRIGLNFLRFGSSNM